MDECPHCGEPIEDDADRCPHCGSDAETGWNPDAEYESLDLPDAELTPEGSGQPELRWDRLVSAAVVGVAAASFIWIGIGAYPSLLLPFLAFLAACLFVYYRWAGSGHE